MDEMPAVQSEVDSLRSNNVNIIILLAHTRPEVYMKIAEGVSGIDVIVLGTANAFFYNGEMHITLSAHRGHFTKFESRAQYNPGQ